MRIRSPKGKGKRDPKPIPGTTLKAKNVLLHLKKTGFWSIRTGVLTQLCYKWSLSYLVNWARQNLAKNKFISYFLYFYLYIFPHFTMYRENRKVKSLHCESLLQWNGSVGNQVFHIPHKTRNHFPSALLSLISLRFAVVVSKTFFTSTHRYF